jgi:hypothetical protein
MPRLVDRAARVAYTFTLMNYAAVAGLVSLLRSRTTWR